MKILVSVGLASSLLVVGCTDSSDGRKDAQTNVAAPSAAHHYECESGEAIAATYSTQDSAKVEYQGSSYDMKIAVSASGARYVGSELEWWTKGSGAGSEGTLLRHLDDGTSGESLELCTEL